MEKVRRNEYHEHTTIFNGLLYKKDCAEAHDFRRMNDLLKNSNPDISWKTKDDNDKILLKNMKSKWKAHVDSLPVKDRPRL